MTRETAGESALELAARRLERAVAALEQRMSQAAPPAPPAGDLFSAGPPGSPNGSDGAMERELKAAAAQASVALGRAIEEIRTALDDRNPGMEA